MSKRIRHHVNPLRLDFFATAAQRVELPADQPDEMEPGCADARSPFARERADDAFANARGAWSFLPHNPFGVQSKRELHCEEDRRPIWRMLYQKKGLSPR